jgi:hypothetical protein
MMAEKARLFNDQETLVKIMAAKHPREQKDLGREVKNFNEDIWNVQAKKIVFKGNYVKFIQHKTLQSLLIATEGTTLVEASPYDTIWGIGLSENDPKALDRATWLGTNWLGEVLTQVRDNILGTNKLLDQHQINTDKNHLDAIARLETLEQYLGETNALSKKLHEDTTAFYNEDLNNLYPEEVLRLNKALNILKDILIKLNKYSEPAVPEISNTPLTLNEEINKLEEYLKEVANTTDKFFGNFMLIYKDSLKDLTPEENLSLGKMLGKVNAMGLIHKYDNMETTQNQGIVLKRGIGTFGPTEMKKSDKKSAKILLYSGLDQYTDSIPNEEEPASI